MIFLAVGTQFPFDRLVKTLDDCLDEDRLCKSLAGLDYPTFTIRRGVSIGFMTIVIPSSRGATPRRRGSHEGRRIELFCLSCRAEGAERAGQGPGGAQERTRTFTTLRPLAPEASASTNSATWARPRLGIGPPWACQFRP